MATVSRVQAPSTGGGRAKPPKNRAPKPPAPPPPPPPPTYNPSDPPATYEPPSNTNRQQQRNRARERARERREKRQERRDRVENVRGRNQELRLRRERSRLLSVENSLLGQPFGVQESLPTFRGEKWNRGSNQSIPNNTQTTIQFGTATLEADRTGFPQIYDSSLNTWTVPAGFGGVWRMSGVARFAGHATGRRTARVYLNSATVLFEMYLSADSTVDQSVWWDVTYPLSEGDIIEFQVFQNSSAALNVLGGSEITHAAMEYLGVY